MYNIYVFFSSRRRHTRSKRDWSSDVCSSDLDPFHGKNDLRKWLYNVQVERTNTCRRILQTIGIRDDIRYLYGCRYPTRHNGQKTFVKTRLIRVFLLTITLFAFSFMTWHDFLLFGYAKKEVHKGGRIQSITCCLCYMKRCLELSLCFW